MWGDHFWQYRDINFLSYIPKFYRSNESSRKEPAAAHVYSTGMVGFLKLLSYTYNFIFLTFSIPENGKHQ